MSENKNSQESPENSPASSPEKSSKKCPDSSPKCRFEGSDMEAKSPSPSIQEQIALFHKDLFGSDEDSGISGGFDGETVEEEARKESMPIISPCSGKNKKRARKEKREYSILGPWMNRS